MGADGKLKSRIWGLRNGRGNPLLTAGIVPRKKISIDTLSKEIMRKGGVSSKFCRETPHEKRKKEAVKGMVNPKPKAGGF